MQEQLVSNRCGKKITQNSSLMQHQKDDSFLVIIDQFDKIKTDERIKRLITENITVIQHTKAEKLSVAVASTSASIVAKNKRNERIKALEEKYKIKLNGKTVRKLKKHPQADEFLKMVYLK